MVRGKIKTLCSTLTVLDQRCAPPMPTTGPVQLYGTTEWKTLIARLIRERGRVCEDKSCRAEHKPRQRIYGDHVIELQDGGAPFDEHNILLRCASSHTIKTNKERAKRLSASLPQRRG